MQKGQLWIAKVQWFRHFHGSIVSSAGALCKCCCQRYMYIHVCSASLVQHQALPQAALHNLRSKQAFDGDQLQNIKLPYRDEATVQIWPRHQAAPLLSCSVSNFVDRRCLSISSIPFTQQTRREHTDPCGPRPTAPTSILSIGLPDIDARLCIFINRYLYFTCQWVVLVLELVLVRSIDFYALFVPWPTAVRTKHWLNCGRRTRC